MPEASTPFPRENDRATFQRFTRVLARRAVGAAVVAVAVAVWAVWRPR